MLVALASEAQTLLFHQLTVKDGLPHNSIITLAQDAKGDIWVATHGGLLRYDGRQFHKLPFEELPDKRVDRINPAPDGTVWVQCFERHQQVSRYDTLSHHFVTYNVSDLSDSLREQAVQPLNRTFADPRSSRVWTIEKRQLWQTDTLQSNSPLIYTAQTGIEAGLKDETFYCCCSTAKASSGPALPTTDCSLPTPVKVITVVSCVNQIHWCVPPIWIVRERYGLPSATSNC